MLNVIICGILGRMGSHLTEACFAADGVNVVCGIARSGGSIAGLPLFGSPDECELPADVLIDFSSPSLTTSICAFCERRSMPLVMCTTGQDAAQNTALRELSARVPVFKSANMSLGVALLSDLSRRAAAVLGDDFDIEIVEKHHRRKLDAPSGTALMLADAINERCGGRFDYVYERQSVRAPRDRNTIGIHSVRGGTIVGEHEVIYAGPDELVCLSHSAQSRAVFAQGALAAARFIVKQPCGIYDMGALIRAL